MHEVEERAGTARGIRRLAALLTLLAIGAAACGRAPRLASSGAAKPAPAADRVKTAAATPSADVAALPVQPAGPPPPIPILMYHVVAVPPRLAPYPGLYVTPALFAAQMAALRQDGYTPITLQQAYDIWNGTAKGPAQPIVLSFDDGYVGVFENAVPILRAYGWPAVLNLQVGRLNIPGGLSTDQVRTMIADGWEVDDHTVTHPDLDLVPPQRLQYEIVHAAQVIRGTFGVPVRFFCYPGGDYNATVIAAVKAAGFLGATTTWPGLADPSVEGAFTLDRVRVAGGESAATLLAVLRHLAAMRPTPPPAVFPPPLPPRRVVPAATSSATAVRANPSATASAAAKPTTATASAGTTAKTTATGH
jgi:peptidoglycan/xylan/chitin deacetylase (PgdA/CDA1 family)